MATEFAIEDAVIKIATLHHLRSDAVHWSRFRSEAEAIDGVVSLEKISWKRWQIGGSLLIKCRLFHTESYVDGHTGPLGRLIVAKLNKGYTVQIAEKHLVQSP